MFQISDISFCFLTIPFNEKFSHASATRAQTESVWVTISTEDDCIGYGEGCPRSYVSGESLQSAAEFIDVIKDDVISSIHDLQSLESWVKYNRYIIDTNPAAWSAIELAILDVIANKSRCSIESLLRVPVNRLSFKYTGVLGNSSLPVFAKSAMRYAHLGFTDFKVKLSGKLSEDKNKLDLLFDMQNGDVRVRVDANNLWQRGEEVVDYIKALRVPIFAIEEPVVKDDYIECRHIARALNVKIILDESFQRIGQFDAITHDVDNWILNLRVSKMGGLLRSLEILEKARELNVPVIIGAHVGETSLMTRAGMLVAQAAGHQLVAQEGAFGTYLLKHDICDAPLMFGKLGELQLSQSMLSQVGFGLSIVPRNIYR